MSDLHRMEAASTCMIYIVGVADTLSFEGDIDVPHDVVFGQMQDIVLHYLADHPFRPLPQHSTRTRSTAKNLVFMQLP